MPETIISFAQCSLKTKIMSPTRIICWNASLFDHVLTSIPSRNLQHGVKVSVSDHELICYIRKNNKTKTGGVTNISFHSFKNCTIDANKDARRKSISQMNDFGLLLFFQQTRAATDNIASCKTKRVNAITFLGSLMGNF